MRSARVQADGVNVEIFDAQHYGGRPECIVLRVGFTFGSGGTELLLSTPKELSAVLSALAACARAWEEVHHA